MLLVRGIYKVVVHSGRVFGRVDHGWAERVGAALAIPDE